MKTQINEQTKQAVRVLINSGSLLSASRVVRCLSNGNTSIELGFSDVDWDIATAFEIIGHKVYQRLASGKIVIKLR